MLPHCTPRPNNATRRPRHQSPIATGRLLHGLLTACSARPFVLTARPEPDLAPWQEDVGHGKSGHAFRYMHLDAQTPGDTAFLFLHGGIFDHRLWYYMHPLAQHGALYALEFPNVHAFHDGGIESMGRIVDDFAALIPETHIYVVGVSAGAWAAVEWAITQRDKTVDGVVLASSVMFGANAKESRKRARMSRFAVGLTPPQLQHIVERRARRTTYTEAEGPLQQIDIFYTRPYPYYYQLFHQTHAQGDRRQNTDGIRCPLLVLHGDRDKVMPLDVARLTPAMFPNATRTDFQVVPGGNHDMIFGNGGDIARRIADFFFE